MTTDTCTHCLHFGHRASQCPVPRNTDGEPLRPEPKPEPWHQPGWPFDYSADDEADSS